MTFEYRAEETNRVVTAQFKKEKEDEKNRQQQAWEDEETKPPSQPGKADTSK